jgi:hypothetical protein
MGAPDDDDPYWDYEDDACWNCGGDGYVYGCSWDWQCDTYDEGEGTCLCTRRCEVCRPRKPNAELQAVLASAPKAAAPGEPPTPLFGR